DVINAANCGVAIPDECEVRSSIRRLEETERRPACGRISGCTAGHGGDAPNPARRANVKDTRIVRIRDNGADRAPSEGVAGITAISSTRSAGRRYKLCPGGAAVRRFVNAQPGFR